MDHPTGRQSKGRVGTHYFDLNIEEVLEHWPVEFAVREVMANAIDEAVITDSDEPTITNHEGTTWRIRDRGRGIRYDHLTQKEDSEKRRHREVIGQFGMGLKDALAVFDRQGVQVEIRSRHSDITTVTRSKEGFPDINTLHAAVRPPSDPGRTGTEVLLSGVTDKQMEAAKHFFLRYSQDQLLETTRYGQVLAKPTAKAPGRIYVRGLLVAQEEDFLFSYNITDLNKPLRRALNRERSNVGRTAYTDRVKAILTHCKAASVANPLAEDLARFASGDMHDELKWREVALHACRVLATHEKVLFVTALELSLGSPQLQYARDEGYRLVTVPETIASKLRDLSDLDGQPLVDLDRYRDEWNDSFQFRFVDPDKLTKREQAIYALTTPAIKLAKLGRARVREVLISETMQLNTTGHPVVGIHDPAEKRIIIRRDQLADAAAYCGVLVHEMIHAATGTTDGTLDFEHELTHYLGVATAAAIASRSPSRVTGH